MGHLVLKVTTKLLVAPIFLFAFYVQWHGDFGPGGGFQAGVIFAVGIILYALVFGLDRAKQALPYGAAQFGAALGVIIFAGVGAANMLLGGEFLNYTTIDPDSTHNAGQHWGILLVEFGVGVTVASVMVLIFYAFSGREPEIDEADW